MFVWVVNDTVQNREVAFEHICGLLRGRGRGKREEEDGKERINFRMQFGQTGGSYRKKDTSGERALSECVNQEELMFWFDPPPK